MSESAAKGATGPPTEEPLYWPLQTGSLNQTGPETQCVMIT